MDMSAMASPPAMHMEMGEMNVECDGSMDPSRKGSWQGHILPGSVFVIWGAWWAYSICVAILRASPSRPYAAQPWFRLGRGRASIIEPLIKTFLPFFAVSIELYFDHDSYRYLYCPSGTKFAGRFAMSHMNNWQHTSIYPAFVLSGVTDLLCLAGVPLPAGVGQSVLSVAFSVMSFLMFLHKKHAPLDAMVHQLLGLAMLMVAIALILEMCKPRSPGLGMARAISIIFLGAWLCEVGIIEFDDMERWSNDYMGSAMFAPVVFGMILLLVITTMIVFFSLLATLLRFGLLASPAPPVYGSGADGGARPNEGSAAIKEDAHRSGAEYAPVATGIDHTSAAERANRSVFQIDV